MLVELEKAIGWLKENADKYIVDMAIKSYEHDFHVGGKCWEDLKATMPEAERPKIKATLQCYRAEIEGADDEEAEIIRKEIDDSEIMLDHVPSDEETITLFNKLGSFNLTIKHKTMGFATADADVKEQWKGKCWTDIRVSKIEIETLNEKTNMEEE